MRIKLINQNFYRLIAFGMVVILVLALGGIAEFHHRQMNLASQLGLKELSSEAPLALKTKLVLINILPLIGSLLPGTILNSLPALIALFVIPRLASRFIHILYDTKDVEEARDYLQRNLYGMMVLQPPIIVKEGRVAVGADSLYNRIGGRALLIVYNDSAAVLEKGGQLTRVVGGPYFGFLERFERVWEVVDLRPQRWVLADNAMTKDGIPISCEADITFKIDDRYEEDGRVRTKKPIEEKIELPTDAAIAEELGKAGIGKPLPYTEDAVRRAATSIWIRIKQLDHPEQLRKWTGRVMIGGVEGTLRNILAQYRLDWLTRPPQSGQKLPREEIQKELEEKLRAKFPVGNGVGAKILNVDLGKINVKDEKISTQWIEAWQTELLQRAMDNQVEGEAQMARMSAAQVQAQAEMVLTLTEVIRPLVANKEDLSSYALALRFIETLQWMAYDPFRRTFLPPEIMRTIEGMKQALGKAEVSAPADGAIEDVRRILMERG